MLTLLAPAALGALALLAIPIVVHIFKPRKVRVIAFSSLRWLRNTPQRVSRRIQWHQIILFILRFSFVLAMVFMLAKPVFSSSKEALFADQFIVLDISRSMSLSVPGKPTPMDRGKEIAKALVGHAAGGNKSTVLFTGTATQSLGPLEEDPSRYQPAIDSVQAGLTATDLASSLPIIRSMTTPRPNSQIDLIYITDNHQQSWNYGGIAAFLRGVDSKVNVKIVDVGVRGARNAWIADARLLTTPRSKVVRAQIGWVGEQTQKITVKLARVRGIAEQTKTVDLMTGRLAQLDFELPPDLDTRGQVGLLKIEPPDALPSDDEMYVPLDYFGTLNVLVVEAPSDADEQQKPGFHLRTALQALSLANNGSLKLTARTSITVTSNEVIAADVIFLAGVPTLTDEVLKTLKYRVKAGAGLAIFLGPTIDETYYNEQLHDPAHPDQSLMPMGLKTIVDIDPKTRELLTLTEIQWTHPMLAPLYDTIYGDLIQTKFRTFYLFDELEGGRATKLASIADRAPAFVDSSFGAGRVVVMNMSANDLWSSMPRQKVFVPLLDRMMMHMTGGGQRRVFELGEPVTVPIPAPKQGEEVLVTAPSGSTVTHSLQNMGPKTVVRVDGANEVGLYQIHVGAAGTLMAMPTATVLTTTKPAAGPAAASTAAPKADNAIEFVVQASRADSNLTSIDLPTLKKWWEPANVELIAGDNNTVSQVADAGRVMLLPWLALLAAGILLLEMFFVHWLCPRMNPATIESRTSRDGLLKPVNRGTGPVTPGGKLV